MAPGERRVSVLSRSTASSSMKSTASDFSRLRPYAWVGFYTCCFFFVVYLGYQLYVTDGDDGKEDKVAANNEVLLEKGKINLMTVLKHHIDVEETEVPPSYGATAGEDGGESEKSKSGVNKMVMKTVEPVFLKYCTNNEALDTQPYLDKTELNVVFNKEFGIKKSAIELNELFKEFDTDFSQSPMTANKNQEFTRGLSHKKFTHAVNDNIKTSGSLQKKVTFGDGAMSNLHSFLLFHSACNKPSCPLCSKARWSKHCCFP